MKWSDVIDMIGGVMFLILAIIYAIENNPNWIAALCLARVVLMSHDVDSIKDKVNGGGSKWSGLH